MPVGLPTDTAIGPKGAPVALAEWGRRAGGYLVDAVIVSPIGAVGYVFARANVPAIAIILYLIQLAFTVWFAVQIGETGQSPGMRVMGLMAVSSRTGQPIGGEMGVLRALLHLVDTITIAIGWLLPMWDTKRQTIADKIVGTVVLAVPPTVFKLRP